jgi:hypothetical protein
MVVLNAVLALGLAFHLARELASPREMAVTDFTVFRTGWTLILEGRARELYDDEAQRAVQAALLREAGTGGFDGGMMAFLHPPHAALAGSALGWIARRWGGPAAFWLWTAMSVTLLAHLARLVRDEWGGGRADAAVVAVTLAAFYPTLETLQQGQVSALLAVAAFGCALAVRRRRVVATALWLLVLSIKPQTVPPMLIFLLARGRWRVLGAAAVGALACALVTAAVLGPSVWRDYLTHLPALERHFATGTPEYMPTVRGLLARLLGPGATVDAASVVAWLVALATVGVVAFRSRAGDDRAPLALALALGALTSPHLFPQDLLLWVAPVALLLSLAHDEGPEVFRRRAQIVLAWPLWFALARAVDVRPTPPPRLPVNPLLVPLVITAAWAARAARQARDVPS